MSVFEQTASAGELWGDRYRIVAPIGTGASAKVWLARDTHLDRNVAIKILHEMHAGDTSFLKRFGSEARAAANLNHPNIMHVYDSGELDGRPYLVLEFVGGGSLRSVLDTSGLLTPSQGLDVALGAAKGLEFAHKSGLVHRDIKPANLLFGEDTRLRIADFGLARALEAADWTEPLGKLLGTAKYASPEQAQGIPLDGRSDVYSLALVIIEACTGEVPFADESKTAMLRARIEPDVVVPRELGRLAPVLASAGRANRNQRPDAGEFMVALLAASAEMDPPTPLVLPGAISADVLNARLAEAERRSSEASEVDLDDLTGVISLQVSGAGETTQPDGLVSHSSIDLSLDDSSFDGTSDGEEDGDPDRVDPGGGRGSWFRSRVLWLLVALALLGAGGTAYWWLAVRIPTFEVPNVVGDLESDALAELGDTFVVESTERYVDGTEAGTVIEQDPPEGRRLAEDEPVSIVVSLGNTLRTFPDFTNPDKDPIDEKGFAGVLKLASLVQGEVTRVHSEDVAEGFVISATSDAIIPSTDESIGDQIPKGAAVDVVFSLGPTPRVIPPGLVGSSFANVKKQLEDQQLVVQRDDRYSDEPTGSVVSVNKDTNVEVPRGTTIVVGVSKGPEPISIPNVEGKSGADAASILEGRGFIVGGIDGSPTAEVLATAPPAGEKHQIGTEVRIFTR